MPIKESLENVRLNQKTLDDKTFRSYLFKIVTIPLVIIFLILTFSYFEALHRDFLRDEIENFDFIILNVTRLEKNFSIMQTSARVFFITREDQLLEPYRNSEEKIQEIENNLFKSIGSNYYWNTLLREAIEKFRNWEDHSKVYLSAHKVSDSSKKDLFLAGEEKMADVKSILLELRKQVGQKKEEAKLRIEANRKLTFYLELGIVIFFVMFLVFIITKQLRSMTSSYQDLLKANFSAISSIEKASKAKDLFLANMSHEIRTPLGAITGFAELASQSKELSPETRNHISFIRRNSEHLLNLIDDLFDLSKLTADKIDIYYENISLIEFVDDLRNLFSSRVHDKKLSLNMIVNNEIPLMIQSDPVRFKQIVSNLVGNAIKFSGASSKVDVVFSFKNKELVVDVIDQGIGITEQAQKTIFEAFRQADPNHSRKYGGAGLGLSISKKLAQALSGDVVLVDSKVNVGSHFRFTIPVRQFAKEQVSQSKIDNYAKTAVVDSSDLFTEKFILSGKKILLAEDSKENQILFRIFIESAKADITVVENGTDAVRQALHNDYDLILMDIQMPGLDGYEAVQILRSSNYKHKIIALTAHTMKGEREKCLAAGFDGYLSKPVSQVKLLRTIQQALQSISSDNSKVPPIV